MVIARGLRNFAKSLTILFMFKVCVFFKIKIYIIKTEILSKFAHSHFGQVVGCASLFVVTITCEP